MAKIDAVKEDISLMSKLLMASVGTMVITAGGVAGLLISGQTGPVFVAGIVVVLVLSMLFYGLIVRVKKLIRRLGDL